MARGRCAADIDAARGASRLGRAPRVGCAPAGWSRSAPLKLSTTPVYRPVYRSCSSASMRKKKERCADPAPAVHERVKLVGGEMVKDHLSRHVSWR